MNHGDTAGTARKNHEGHKGHKGHEELTTKNEVFAELRKRFPEILNEIDDGISTGLLHLEISALSHFAQESINAENKENVRRCFDFADWAHETGDPNVVNAINVSFLEHLSFSDSKKHRRSWALQLLSDRLLKANSELMDYLQRLHSSS